MSGRYFLAGVLIVVLTMGSVAATRWVRGMPKAVEPESWKVKGDPNAKNFIVDYSDFACSYCSKISLILDEALKDYPKDLKIIFKHYPLRMHPASMPAAEASECAADQGKFWEYHDILFQNQSDWAPSKEPAALFIEYAGRLGLDKDKFKQCLNSHVKKDGVEKNRLEGRRFYVSGTPTLILNGRKSIFAYKPEDLKSIIRKEIDRGKKR